LITTKHVIPAKAVPPKAGQENTGFPRIEYGAGLIKPGMTNWIRFMSSRISWSGQHEAGLKKMLQPVSDFSLKSVF